MTALKIIREFSRGSLELDIQRADLEPEELFGFAERANPKRAFLFVSKVLGRHIPVAPAVMRGIWQMLARRIDADSSRPMLFIGMAETAIALGAGIFREFQGRRKALFLADTRHRFDRPLLAGFAEEHSHAMRHNLYQPEDADFLKQPLDVVSIDDEMTTGRTFANLRAALLAARLKVVKFIPVVIKDWSGGEDANISLLKGSWIWKSRGQGCAARPVPGENACGAAISPRQDWGRFGATNVDLPAWPEIHARKGGRVLVLGSGEFVWPPFLLAERLENEGAKVLFGATTRSPIKIGMTIKSKVEFMDNYGLGIPNYLYNVNPDDYDRIYLCVETGRDSVAPALLEALKKAVVLEY